MVNLTKWAKPCFQEKIMIELADSHCHIHSIESLKGDKLTNDLWSKLDNASIKEVIKDAKKAGVTRFIAVGVNLNDSRLAIKAANNYSSVWATIGIHPHEANNYHIDQTKLEAFSRLAKSHKVVAIGECGLDYHYSFSTKTAQIKLLKFQIELASTNNLPIIFHVREAFKDFWPIFDSYNNLKGVLHSYTDNQANLKKALDRGLYIGVNGIATFTKEPSQTKVYQSIPLSKLLLETDSPFLTPVPLRGKINQPKNVRLVAEYLASLRHETLADIATQTTANCKSLFNL